MHFQLDGIDYLGIDANENGSTWSFNHCFLFHLNVQIIKVSLIIKVYKHIDNLIFPLSLDYLYLIHQISSIFFFDQIDDKTILFVIYTN